MNRLLSSGMFSTMPAVWADRDKLYNSLQRTLGQESAQILMSYLPDDPVTDLLTRADLQSELSPIRVDLDAVKGDVAVLKGDVAVLKGDVAVLKAGLAQVSTDIDRLYAMMRVQTAGIYGGFFALLAAIIATRFFG